MPKLRESLMRERRGGPIETFSEEDERGNLSIWQEGGYDMDPVQAGIQDNPSVGAPPDPDAKPIFMTNIPQGGFGPSLDSPGGVPGSEQDRAQMDEQAAAAGTTVMDLSSKQKTPKPPAWVNPEVDLNAPGERERFKQTFREDAFGGVNLPDIDPVGEASRKWDPALYPKEFKQLADTLTTRVKAAREVEDRIMAEFDKNAAIQAAMRKHKSEAEKAKGADIKSARARYLELGKSYTQNLTDKQKLIESLGTAFDETAKDAIKAQIQELDNIGNDIKFQMKGLEGIPGVKPKKVDTAPYKDRFFDQMGMGAGRKGEKTPTSGAPQQTEAQKFALYGKSQNWSPERTLSEWKKLKTSGAGTKTPTGKQAPSPARIVKPAPTTKPSTPTASFGPPMPTANPQPSGVDIGGPPVTIDTKSMVELAKSVGLTKENLGTYLKVAADINGSTVELLLTKPYNAIKQLLKQAVSSQSATRKQMGL